MTARKDDEAKEAFLSRWSRLKREAPAKRKALEEKKALDAQPAPALPPLEELTPQSEFAPFMHPKVDDALRRVALRKLFADPHFNAPDVFEPFSGDWTGGETITPELLATLNQTRSVLFPQGEPKAEEPPAQAEREAERGEKEREQDEPGRQDA